MISDIDDTILLTGLTEGVAMVARTLLREAEERRRFPAWPRCTAVWPAGCPDPGRQPQAEPTFFYVSTGSWSFYSMLQQFIQLRGFPQGPMFLTDWGPTERYLRRSGAEHKRTAIRRLFEAYPGMQFVLVGDSGQRDPLTYEEMAREFPGRVKLIVIRQVGADDDERNSELRAKAAALRGEGIPLYLVADAAEAAELAHGLDLCDEQTLQEVSAERAVRCLLAASVCRRGAKDLIARGGSMGAARHVGRVGGLAVALGIGAAVLSGAATAWASPDSESSGPAPSHKASAQSARHSAKPQRATAPTARAARSQSRTAATSSASTIDGVEQRQREAAGHAGDQGRVVHRLPRLHDGFRRPLRRWRRRSHRQRALLLR